MFYIDKVRLGYYITLEIEDNSFCNDWEIAEFLGISTEKYQSKLKKCGGKVTGQFNDTYFKCIEDVEQAIDELTPIYMILKLSKC